MYKRIMPAVLAILAAILCWQAYGIREQNKVMEAVRSDIESLEARKEYLEKGWWDNVPPDNVPMPTLSDTYLPLMDYIEFCEANYGLRITLNREKKGQVKIDNITPVEYAPVKLAIQYEDIVGLTRFLDSLLQGFPLEVTSLSWKEGKVEIIGTIWGRSIRGG